VIVMTNRDAFAHYYPNRSVRDSPPPNDGMYARDRSPPHQYASYGTQSPQTNTNRRFGGNNSLDDLRREFNQIDGELKLEDFTWEKMGSKVQDLLEKKANQEPIGGEHSGDRYFQPPKRRRDRSEMPVLINGNIVPRKDALLIDLVLNNKSTLDAQLSTCKQPIIGLEFMVEYIDPEGGSPRVYHCRLCKQFNTCSSVMEHITGYNHRVRYIALKYPNQAKTYLMPNGRQANRNFTLIRMAAGRCQELELVYGRGDFEVRHERPTLPKEEDIDMENDDFEIDQGKQTEVLKNALDVIRSCRLEAEEDVRIAKSIINDLTDSIIEFKQSSSEERMNTGISNLLNQSRSNY